MRVSQADDPLEREAEAIAARVMSGKTLSGTAQVLRKEKRKDGAAIVPDTLSNRITATRGSGAVLPEGPRNFMERKLETDLSMVRIHTDTNAIQLASELDAQAFTVGNDVYFNAGKYSPQSDDGKRLLAHELTHVVQQRENQCLQAQPNKRSSKVPTKTPEKARDEAFDVVNEVELALDDFVSRYRNWLTHNTLLLMADVLKSGKGQQAFALKDSFAEGVGQEIIVNLLALGPTKVSESLLEELPKLLLLSAKAGTLLGGVVTFLIGSILESVLGEIFNKTSELVDKTTEQLEAVITGLVNPIANKKQKRMRVSIQQTRDVFRKLDLTAEEWEQQKESLLSAKRALEDAIVDENDSSLYRQLSLKAKIYSGYEVIAEKTITNKVSSKKGQFPFAIKNQFVDSGYTKINVGKDNSKVVIRMRSYDCEDGLTPINFETEAKDRPVVFSTLDRDFRVALGGAALAGERERSSMNKKSRVFHVGKDEYGVWYDVKKGVYTLDIYRNRSHPVGLCGIGNYSVE